MNKYLIYWIKEDIAYHFYHKGEVLYRFFLAHNQHKGKLLSAQYDYITKRIPHHRLTSHIYKYCINNNINILKKGQVIELYKDDHYIALHFEQRNMVVYCYTIHSAEKIIFPILRLFHSLFFIIDQNHQKHGWISPFMKNKPLNDKEKLYSLR